MDDESIRERVKAKYGQAALRVTGEGGSCCGDGAPSGAANPVTSDLYQRGETAELPSAAVQASLGCGNPVALADLRPGEVVLDLGSGAGLDVLLSARRVGPTGKAYGLDMTDEMLALARANQAKAGLGNVEFLKGEIERIPLPDASVDAIISNCVINLSADKPRVFAEAFRVLRPGGRFAVHDIVVTGAVSDLVRRNVEAWTGCLAGALDEDEYRRLLVAAGFEAVTLEPTRIYRAADVRAFVERQPSLLAELGRRGGSLETLLAEADGKFRSAFIRAVKPAASRPFATPAIVRAELEDLTSVLALLADASLPREGVPEHFGHFWVARAGGRVVGAVGMEPYGASALLRSLVVAPTFRGQGLGRALAGRLLAAARARGVARVFLLTEAAADFFSRLGFKRIAREEADPAVRESVEFKTVCCQSAVCMGLEL